MWSRLMKRILNKFRGGEKGQALILALILMLLGGLIIAPLLGYMGTGLKIGKDVHEERMLELYAADAGIEDAIWKTQDMQFPDPEVEYSYTIAPVNGKNVTITIPPRESTMLDFLVNIGVLPDKNGTYQKASPHSEFIVVYTPIESSQPGIYDTYRVTVYSSMAQKRSLLGTGFWIMNYAGDTEVIPWQTGVDNLVDIDLDGDGVIEPPDEKNIATKPLIDGYPYNGPGVYPYPSRIADFMGTPFIWEWDINKGPMFGKKAEGGADVYCRTQRFTLVPPLTPEDDKLPLNVAWVKTKQEDVMISWSGDITGIRPIIAVATDPATNKSTTVESYVFVDPVTVTILTWDISP
jgi:hypothetical protein